MLCYVLNERFQNEKYLDVGFKYINVSIKFHFVQFSCSLNFFTANLFMSGWDTVFEKNWYSCDQTANTRFAETGCIPKVRYGPK